MKLKYTIWNQVSWNEKEHICVGSKETKTKCTLLSEEYYERVFVNFNGRNQFRMLNKLANQGSY